MLDKIQFQNGTIVTKEYLNEVQKGSSFSAPTSRDDYYAEPTEAEHAGWDISQRDRLKDWEIADPREDNETGVGRLAHDGVVLNSYNPSTLEKVWGPPALIETAPNSGVYGVWVEAGSIVLSDGQPISWGIQFVQLLSGVEVNYLYISEEGVRKNIEDNEAIEISIDPGLPSVSKPHIPLAKLTLSADGTSLATNEDGEVAGVGYVDLRPSLYIGNLNTYPRTLRNTEIKEDSYVAKAWERVIADTSNGSLIVSLPSNPTDSDRIAVVDISGTFDRFPIVIRPGEDTKISNSIDDWIINIKDAHIELFYHAATAEWKFEETPGGDCSPVLGTFLSCGGREFIGQRLPEECPDGATIPAIYPNPPEGSYRYEASTSKCYKEFYPTVAVYANGQGGLIKVQDAPRCNRAAASSTPEVRNIIYVDPSIGDDSLANNGFSDSKPFRSLERAIIEGVRESRRSGAYNDRYDRVMIQLAPGDYYVDNSPGTGSISGITADTGLIQRVDTGFKVLDVQTQDRAIVIQVDSLSPTLTQPPRALNLGRVLYSQSGGVGNIVKIEKESLNSSIWKVTLEYVRGGFSLNDQLYYDGLSSINPTGGGIVIPRGISINGVDLRKVRIRPMYVPELNPIQEEPQREKTAIFKLTGGSYVSLLTFTDNPQIHRSHNTVTSVGFASQTEIAGSSTETSYYSKLNSLFGQYDGWGSEGLEAISAETTIVAPIYDSKDLRQTDAEENQTGVPLADSRSSTSTAYPGATKLRRQGSGDQRPFDLPDINSTRSSSPYVFNCSVRSIFGLNGLHADGALVAGFKSMVTANFTQVSLQTDPTCFNDQAYYLDPPTNKQDGVGKQYRVSPADPFKYRHFGFKGSNNATIQIVSCFVIGNADHFVSESGGDLSITNSCSDFGDISLHSIGYKTRSFSQDEGVPSGTYGGTKLIEIVPPLPLSYEALTSGQAPTLVDSEINTGLVLDYDLTKDWYVDNSPNETPPSTVRVYFRNSNASAPFTESTNVPSARRMGFGQFSYTRKKSDGSYELSGGTSRNNRKRFYIKGFNELGESILYAGDIQLVTSTLSPGYEYLDDASKIFIWDSSKSCWFVNLRTSNIVEEVTDLDGDGYLLKKLDYAFRFKILLNPTGSNAFYSDLDFLFPKASLTTIRGLDRRKEEERIYKIVLEGFLRDQGMRRPQSFYVLEKQIGVSGYPLNGSSNLIEDPLVISQVRDYDEVFDPEAYQRRLAEKAPSDGLFVAYLTQASQARRVVSGELYPAKDFDEPERTADPQESITREALAEMLSRPGVYFDKPIEPSSDSISVKVRSSSATGGILIGLRRPSVIRASGHTWEWTGYLNYDTAFPTFQGEPLEQDYALGKIIVERGGGKVYATGMNEEGSFYIGTTVFDLRTGEQFAIPLEADNEPGSVTNQVFNSVVIRSTLALGDGSSMYFGNDTNIYFDSSTTFNTTTGPITANQNPLPEVYATSAKAGLVQLADTAVIRGALGSGSQGIADKVAVTAAALARELEVRFSNSVSAGDGITVVSASVELPGGDPTDPSDNITQFLISVKPEYGGFTPVGGIIMWSGPTDAVPANWALCNGANGTPDLRNRFIVGTGSSYAMGATGGSADAIVVEHTHTATSTVNDPGHTHSYVDDARANDGIRTDLDDNMFWLTNQTKTTGSSTTGISVTTTVANAGASGTNANLPPYYALAFIMRIV
jgi:microcystin-dependent protein